MDPHTIERIFYKNRYIINISKRLKRHPIFYMDILKKLLEVTKRFHKEKTKIRSQKVVYDQTMDQKKAIFDKKKMYKYKR